MSIYRYLLVLERKIDLFCTLFFNWRRPFWGWNVLPSEAVYHVSYALRTNKCHVNVGGHMRAQLVLDRGNNTKWTFSTTPYLEGLEGISEATRSTITNHVHTHTCPHISMHRHTLMHIHFHIQKNKEHCVSLTKLFPRGDFLCLYKQCLTQYTYIPTPCVSKCQQPTHIR